MSWSICCTILNLIFLKSIINYHHILSSMFIKFIVKITKYHTLSKTDNMISATIEKT